MLEAQWQSESRAVLSCLASWLTALYLLNLCFKAIGRSGAGNSADDSSDARSRATSGGTVADIGDTTYGRACDVCYLAAACACTCVVCGFLNSHCASVLGGSDCSYGMPSPGLLRSDSSSSLGSVSSVGAGRSLRTGIGKPQWSVTIQSTHRVFSATSSEQRRGFRSILNKKKVG